MKSKIKKLKNHKTLSFTINREGIQFDFQSILKISSFKYWFFLNLFNLFGFEIELSRKQDHAGILLTFILFGYWIELEWYDQRHWDYQNNCWEKYD